MPEAFDKAWSVVKARPIPPEVEAWLKDYFSYEDSDDEMFFMDPESGQIGEEIPYPKWKELNPEGDISDHWFRSRACDCNISGADKRENLEELFLDALDEDPNANLEEVYQNYMDEAQWKGGGQGRARKWGKSVRDATDDEPAFGRCGHCGGQASLDSKTGLWGQFF